MEVTEPLLEKVTPLPVPPFLLDNSIKQSLEQAPPPMRSDPPPLRLGPICAAAPQYPPLTYTATWTFAKKTMSGHKLPQTIAHRGYKIKHPENTMGAFKGAVAAGADAIETDIHLTKDNVVVLSHDATLKRCFSTPQKIISTTWPQIAPLRTTLPPHEPMPRLLDLLYYLSHPSRSHIWILLDIKPSNTAPEVLRLIASTIASVPPTHSPNHPNETVPWTKRIILGIWTLHFLPFCHQYLPGFAVAHIGFSLPYARKFLDPRNPGTKGVGFNMLQKSLACPVFGKRFLRDARRAGRPVMGWTVNGREGMMWCVDRGLDGVVTDDVEGFEGVKRRWESGERGDGVGVREWMLVLWYNFLVLLFVWRLKGVELWKRVKEERGESRRVAEII